MALIINNEQEEVQVSEGLIEALESLAKRILSAHGRNLAEVGITLTDYETIQQLNRDYRGVDAPTDVLSFALDEGEGYEFDDEDEIPDLLGDVIICLPRAREQAAEYGHSFEREVLYLAAHGLLHLLGYDHQEEAKRQRMREEEERFLIEEGWPRTDG